MCAWLLPIVVLALTSLAGCGIDYDAAARHRSEYARKGEGDIVVAAIEEPWAASYFNGINLAVKQVNARPGKLLGRKLSLLVKTSSGEDFDEVRGTVLGLAKNPRVIAVLGHRRTDIAISAAAVYEPSKLIFMPPFSSANGLGAPNFKFVFSMLPDNAVMAGQIASLAELLGHKNIVLLYAQDEYNRKLALLFEDAAINRGMGLVHRGSFKPEENDYRGLINQFADKSADLVFLAADAMAGARMVRQLRELGVTAPVMGGEALNAGSFSKQAGPAGDNTIVPILYHAQAGGTQANQGFIAEYQKLYGTEPDQDAAQGYASMRLLVNAVEQVKSTEPARVSSSLHYLPFWASITGVHAFDRNGVIYGKKYFFQVLRDGQWNFLPGVHMPYFLERFDRSVKAQANHGGVPPAFAKRFAINLNPDDLRSLQLDFLHEVVQFQQLGVVYGEQRPGQVSNTVSRMVELGKTRGFGVTPCGVALAMLDKSQVERQLLDCYGKLALNVNALNVTGLNEADKDSAVRLQRPLKKYKIPVLALQGDTDFDADMAIRIGKFGDRQDIRTEHYLNLFGGILHGVKVYELAEKLENLPILEVNLQVLNDYGLLHSAGLSGLEPYLYLEWLFSSQ